jgi:GMP synthase (glutamine-hydrolysing)
MKNIWIIKAGGTFPGLATEHGDFEHWICREMGLALSDVRIYDVRGSEPLPESRQCAGVVVTGSHAMVTDKLPWSRALENWIPELVAADVPFLGICYGHQLLASALGGEVKFHPSGREIGSVEIRLHEECDEDPLFRDLPQTIRAHVVHSQTVTRLPSEAIRLASNDHEPVHAYRVGAVAWGVQFHPEFDEQVMRKYVEEYCDRPRRARRNSEASRVPVLATPEANQVLARFAKVVDQHGR